jgi:hypothetical protein
VTEDQLQPTAFHLRRAIVWKARVDFSEALGERQDFRVLGRRSEIGWDVAEREIDAAQADAGRGIVRREPRRALVLGFGARKIVRFVGLIGAEQRAIGGASSAAREASRQGG